MSASLSDEEIEERFFLLGRMEILNVLNDLIQRREPVTVYFNNGQDFFLSTLLEARPEALIFDLGGNEKINLRLQNSPACTFVTQPDGIRVQFSGAQVNRFSWGGSDAFWVPLPEHLVRMQRRESYRILLPVANALKVKLFSQNRQSLGEWPIHDLSVGGLGATVNANLIFEPNQIIGQLEFTLPNQRSPECAGTVRHVTRASDQRFEHRNRIGIAFSELPRQMEVSVQRYVIMVEHERRKLQFS
jgi:c-di-GMP-binding flagellar brake protein YcgR